VEEKVTGKGSPGDTEHAARIIRAAIEEERQAREKEGYTFTGLTSQELAEKLKRANSPMIVFQGWDNSAPPGGAISYTVGVFNPDPVGWGQLSVAVSVGNRNPIVSNDGFLSDSDRRFPTLAQPATLGFALGPLGSANASASFSFVLNLPDPVEKTGYFGNTVLEQVRFHDVGLYLDRAVFFFSIV